MENIVRKGEIACYKQFLLFSQCFLPYMVFIFHFKCTLKGSLKFVSILTSLKFCRLGKGFNQYYCNALIFLMRNQLELWDIDEVPTKGLLPSVVWLMQQLAIQIVL